MTHFTLHEEQIMTRLRVLQELLGKAEFNNTPCPLLDAQLAETLVVLDLLRREITAMQRARA